MEVYIEDVFLDNLVIDFIILFVTGKLLRLKTGVLRLILGSMLGVIAVIMQLVFGLTGGALFVFKIFSGVLMVLIAFPFVSLKRFCLGFLTFFVVTFVLGGAIFAVTLSFGDAVTTQTGEVLYNLAMPIWLLIIVVFVVVYVFFQIILGITSSRKHSQFIFDATLMQGKKIFTTKAFLDTGNILMDPKTNKPVIFVSYDTYLKLFNGRLEDLILKKSPSPGAHYIKTGTVNSTTNTLVVTLEKLTIKKDKECFNFFDLPLAVTFNNLEKKLNCGLLLNFNLLNGEYYEQT